MRWSRVTDVTTKATLALLASLVLVVCNSPSPAPPSPSPSCGMSPSDWCASPPGDACGAHRDTASCRADPNCEGMPYQGESAVPCIAEERCFASNCPTVGCVTRCEALGAACATLGAGRCQVDPQGACLRSPPCGPPPSR